MMEGRTMESVDIVMSERRISAKAIMR